MARKLPASVKAAIRLIDEMGAEVMVRRRAMPEMDDVARLKARLGLERDAQELWDRDVGDSNATSLVFPRWSEPWLPRAGRITVVGPMPTGETVRRGWGASRAERALAHALDAGGVRGGSITWLGASWEAADDRPPTTAELARWAGLTRRAIEAADAEYLLLHGAHAMRLWRRDLGVGDLTGRIGLYREQQIVAVVPHASTVLGARHGWEQWMREVEAFAWSVQEGAGFEALGQRCMKCRDAVWGYDPDGLPWCREHYATGLQARDRADRRAAKDTEHEGQGALL